MSDAGHAEITANLNSAPVVAGAKKVSSVVAQLKKEGEGAAKSTKSVGEAAGAAKAQTSALGSQVDALKSSLSPTKLLGGAIGGFVVASIGAAVNYLREGAVQAREFGDKTANAARRAGTDLTTFRAAVAGTEKDTQQSADAQVDLVNQVQRLSYGGATAAASLRGLGATATASGREIQEYAGVVASLQDGLRLTGNVSGEIDRLIATSGRLGTMGGPDALLDTIAALRPAFAQVNTEAAGAAAKLEAFAAVASKKLRPEQAQGVVAGAIGTIEARAYDIQRATGEDPLDEKGDVRDPLATLKTLRDRALKQNRTRGEATMGLTKVLGARTARFVMSKDFDTIDEEAKNQDRAQTEAALQAFLKTPEGARRALEIRGEQAKRGAGELALRASDTATEGAYGAWDAGRSIASQSFAPPTSAPTPAAPASGDWTRPDPGRLGQGPLKLEFPDQVGFANKVGEAAGAAAGAKAAAAIAVHLPVNWNAGKVQ